ncbi:hypothetical protein FQA39_LY09775 [Lamprigera yunnana]|nr:hypothetical protein FQA39_LY09775 [Lamprigera yunnana]
MPFTPGQDRFIVMAHFRSGTLNPDGNWSYSLQSCIEQFMQQYLDEMIEYDIFKQHKCSSNSNAENTVSLEKPGKCPNRLGFPICSRTCVNDMICSGAHKCCKTDCGGSVCIEVAKQPELLPRFVSPRLHIVAETHEGIPVISGQNLSKVVKTGSCPRILNYPVCGLTCSDDQACDTTSKCCPTKCGGSLCVEPITQHPTKTPGNDSHFYVRILFCCL